MICNLWLKPPFRSVLFAPVSRVAINSPCQCRVSELRLFDRRPPQLIIKYIYYISLREHAADELEYPPCIVSGLTLFPRRALKYPLRLSSRCAWLILRKEGFGGCLWQPMRRR